ncbi:ABC transporter substrate-binding protein [Ruthenibacterium sp. TH_2024_36131]|uniref:ABC transporter substrate-binding protein n=1 Tax=Owariibacterium komagatae TaxID=3136601 RepID=UPI0038B3AD88
MYKKIAALAMSVVLMLSMAACSAQNSSDAPGSDTSSAESISVPESVSAPEEEAAFPVTVKDAAGREVTIEEEPEKLVSGYYITTSMVIALGQQDKLVGVEAKADSRPIYSLAAPELLELPSVGTAKEFDLEGCAALEPDLVVLPLKLKDTVSALEELGIPVLLANPEDLTLLRQTIEMLGAATGAQEQADALLAYNQQTEDDLKALLDGVQRPTVYLAGNSSYLSTAGAKMYQNTLIELGGGDNVAAELEDDYWAEVSYEQLLAWNPQVIVIVPEASYTKDDLMNDPQLAQLDAVKNGQVYQMPSSFEAWDSPVPSAMLGSRWMAAVLHEDVYSFETFCNDAEAFYSQFYGIEIDTSLLTK